MASCHSCARVATDDNPSAWLRCVVGSEQVLVCETCIDTTRRWLRTCLACGSVKLHIVLGDVVCRTCGHTEGT